MNEILRVRPEDGADWGDFCRIISDAFACGNGGGADPTTENYVLKKDARVVAVGSVDIAGDYVDICNLAVDKGLRGQGHGREMLARIEEKIAPRFNAASLMTKEHNMGFYEAAGYRLGNTLPNSDGLHFMSKGLR